MPNYEEMHWGKTPPRGEFDVKQAIGPMRIVGEIAAISYASDKGEDGKIYRHEFEQHDGRGPYLLHESDDGDQEIRIENPAPQHEGLGQVIDFELKDGRRLVVGGGAMLGVDPKSGMLSIVSERGVPYQIEQRPNGHFVTEHGIEE